MRLPASPGSSRGGGACPGAAPHRRSTCSDPTDWPPVGGAPGAAATALGVALLGVPALSVVLAAPTGAVTGPAATLTAPTARHHGYRHGAVPRRTRDVAGVEALLADPATRPVAPRAAARVNRKLLTYGGGTTANGLVAEGVTTGQPRVYLVFMGSQWVRRRRTARAAPCSPVIRTGSPLRSRRSTPGSGPTGRRGAVS